MSQDTQPAKMFRDTEMDVAVLMTGGTIAKSYDPASAKLENVRPTVKDLIAKLRLDDLNLKFFDYMQKDSLDIKENERERIGHKIGDLAQKYDAVLVTHGTDSMVSTAELLCAKTPSPTVPVIFTGAMIPGTVIGSDAQQNLTEALLALRFLPPGIYLSFHNRILTPPGIRKNYENQTFEKVDQ